MKLFTKLRIKPIDRKIEFNFSIFLVLLFFFCSSCQYPPSNQRLKLPKKNQEILVESANLKVKILRSGAYSINGSIVTPLQIKEEIKTKIQENGSAKKVSLTISPEEGAALEKVVHLLDMARILNITTLLDSPQN